MGIIIFQLLSCLYLCDSGIRKPIQYINSGFWPGALRTMPPVYQLLAVALIYRAAGILASGVQRVNSSLKYPYKIIQQMYDLY